MDAYDHPLFFNKWTQIILAILVFGALVGLTNIPLHPVDYPLNCWQKKGNTDWMEVCLPDIESMTGEISTVEYRTRFPAIPGNTLVIPRQSGNAIEVTLNNRVIYTLGDPDQPTANLWNYVHLVPLQESLQEENTLIIKIWSSNYGMGINAVPYITSYTNAAWRVAQLNAFYNDSLLIGSGIALALSVLLFLLAILRKSQGSVEFYTACCLLFSVLYTQDAIFRVTSGTLTEFLWMKKIIMISGYLSGFFFAIALEKYYLIPRKIHKWLLALVSACMLMVLLAPSLEKLTQVLNYTNVIQLVTFILCIVIILFSKNTNSWMLFPATLLALAVIQMLFTIPMRLNIPSLIYAVILIVVNCFAIFIILDFYRLYQENEILKKEKYLDPLTGAMNRNILQEFSVNSCDFIVMLDMDNFKRINDTYGHSVGDELLVQYVRIFRQNMRQGDLVVRYGGDEFLLLFHNLPHTATGHREVEGILKRIQDQFAVFHPEIDPGFSYGIAEINDDFQTALNIADQNMYLMKEQKES